jgi:Uma2 family endonuclease
MTTATTMKPPIAPALPAAKPEVRVVQRIRIDDADWATYEKFLAAIGDRGIRCTYDQGRLEIMAPLRRHEHEKKFLGRMVETTTFELMLPLGSCGSMTIRREDLLGGFEPDECYYIAHAVQMSDLREPDFSVDPPPDLAIEIDITSSSLDRLALYAALGIPELWRLDEDGVVQLLHLQPDRKYAIAERSLSFPFLTREVVNNFLQMYLSSRDENGALRSYCQWLLATVRPAAPSSPTQPTNGPAGS